MCSGSAAQWRMSQRETLKLNEMIRSRSTSSHVPRIVLDFGSPLLDWTRKNGFTKEKKTNCVERLITSNSAAICWHFMSSVEFKLGNIGRYVCLTLVLFWAPHPVRVFFAPRSAGQLRSEPAVPRPGGGARRPQGGAFDPRAPTPRSPT